MNISNQNGDGSLESLFLLLIIPSVVVSIPVPQEAVPCGGLDNKHYCIKNQFCNNDLKPPRCENCWDYSNLCFTRHVNPNCNGYCKDELEAINSKNLQNASTEYEQRRRGLIKEFNRTLENINREKEDQIKRNTHLWLIIVVLILLISFAAITTLIAYVREPAFRETVRSFLPCVRNIKAEFDKQELGEHKRLLSVPGDKDQQNQSNDNNDQTALKNRIQTPVHAGDENYQPLQDGTQDNEPPRSSSDLDILGEAVNASNQTTKTVDNTGTLDTESPRSSSDTDIPGQAVNATGVSEQAIVTYVAETEPVQNSELPFPDQQKYHNKLTS